MDSLSVGYLVRFFSSSTSARWMPSLVETLVQHNSSWSASRMSLEESYNKNPTQTLLSAERNVPAHIYFKGGHLCSLAELIREACEKQCLFLFTRAKHRWSDRPGKCSTVSWSHPPMCFLYWNEWQLLHCWLSQAEQKSLLGLGDVPLHYQKRKVPGNSIKQSPKIILAFSQQPFIIFNPGNSIPQAFSPVISLQRVWVSTEDMSKAGQTRIFSWINYIPSAKNHLDIPYPCITTFLAISICMVLLDTLWKKVRYKNWMLFNGAFYLFEIITC